MLKPGDTLNHGAYRILSELGSGGFGVVYLAEEVALGRHVAIKIIRPDVAGQDRNVAAGFYNEARMNAALDHPHIVRINYVGQETVRDGPVDYIVMEYAEGGDLDTVLARDGADMPQRIRWMNQIAEGLAYAHQQGVIHRDLKLRNVLLSRDRSAKIGDFGLAKAVGTPTMTEMKGRGTPAYASPEFLRGQPTDLRSDVYSLGVVYYQMLTGRLPYDAPDATDSNAKVMAICYQHEHAPIPSARTINPAVPPDLDGLVQRMMAKSPDERPASALEVFQDLAAVPAHAGDGWRFPVRWLAIPAALVLIVGVGYGARLLWPTFTRDRKTEMVSPPTPVSPVDPNPIPAPMPPTPEHKLVKQDVPTPGPHPVSPVPVPAPMPPAPEPRVAKQDVPTSGTRPVRPAPTPTPAPPAPGPNVIKPALLQERLEQRLRAEQLLDVTVAVAPSGTVTLGGVVDKQAQRDRAVNIAREMAGTAEVRQNINARDEWGK